MIKMLLLHTAIINISLICIFISIFTCECCSQESHEQTGSKNDLAGPAGHLKPLGSAKDKLPIDVVHQYLSPIDFFANYVYASKPVVFKGVAKTANAFQYWTDNYLADLPDSLSTIVDVEYNKKENRLDPSMDMSLTEFFNRYKNEDIYLVTDVPTHLRKDVPVPKSLICQEVLKKLVATVMWISNGGTKSVLHNDDVDNINCLYSGKKEIIFIDYKYRENVTLDKFLGGYSSVDIDEVDLLKYPGLTQVEFHYAEMSAGDCIFIPYKWFHQVNSYHRNLAVNLWWAHDAKMLPTPTNCGSPDLEMSLADVTLKDELEADIEIQDPASDMISLVMAGGQFSLSNLTEYFKTYPSLTSLTWTDECDRIIENIFRLMDNNNDGVLVKEDIIDQIETIEDKVEFNSNVIQDILLMENGQKLREELLQYLEKEKIDQTKKEEL
ncbi:bifunctional peptidase and (3S)-lysyl hydroxylase Jmjd7-like [Antedon mediterranea]|uniref:bifunctional peptidase and (3S)-lysyl hydroxylase Jmjd7-like n=1 Tax=Antedon mediterranea TaxID=105859 RepID=UPI003AF576CE